jgi:DNA-binding transcriptional ArsR family regulator
VKVTGAQAPGQSCCTNQPARERDLLHADTAAELEALFKVMANITRLRLLHAIVKAQELCVTDLANELGMRPQAVSNQLQRLLDRGIVACRRNGNQIFYSVVNPCVPALLDYGLCILSSTPKGLSHVTPHAPGNTSEKSARPESGTT